MMMIIMLGRADSLFAPVKKPGFYLHHIEVADQDSPASLEADYKSIIYKSIVAIYQL